MAVPVLWRDERLAVLGFPWRLQVVPSMELRRQWSVCPNLAPNVDSLRSAIFPVSVYTGRAANVAAKAAHDPTRTSRTGELADSRDRRFALNCLASNSRNQWGWSECRTSKNTTLHTTP
jgi:hypothetical protein